jgi:hypothetical protein
LTHIIFVCLQPRRKKRTTAFKKNKKQKDYNNVLIVVVYGIERTLQRIGQQQRQDNAKINKHNRRQDITTWHNTTQANIRQHITAPETTTQHNTNWLPPGAWNEVCKRR